MQSYVALLTNSFLSISHPYASDTVCLRKIVKYAKLRIKTFLSHIYMCIFQGCCFYTDVNYYTFQGKVKGQIHCMLKIDNFVLYVIPVVDFISFTKCFMSRKQYNIRPITIPLKFNEEIIINEVALEYWIYVYYILTSFEFATLQTVIEFSSPTLFLTAGIWMLNLDILSYYIHYWRGYVFVYPEYTPKLLDRLVWMDWPLIFILSGMLLEKKVSKNRKGGI